MADIQQLLSGLSSAKITPTVLKALDFVVPGEWVNVTSLDEAVRQYAGVTDPAEAARIKERALALWSARPHYARAVKIFQAVDTADKVTTAAIVANQVGGAVSLLGILNKLTPKPDTAQAIDAALKLAAEVAAFATLRGLPTSSLAEAKAFPAAVGSYARADLMRLAAWIAIDGILPLGPEFVQKITDIVSKVDTSMLTNNPMFGAIKDAIPGGSPDAQKGFILSSLQSGGSYINEFVAARGLTREGLASKLGTAVAVGDAGMDVLAAALDVGTDYYTHTGIQSVARVLVGDAQESLASGEVVAPGAPAPEPTEQGSSWFRTAAVVGGVGAAAAGAAAIGGAALLWKAWNSGDDEDEDDDALESVDAAAAPDPELDNLDQNGIAARMDALRMKARQIIEGPGTDAEKEAKLAPLRGERDRLRRARRRNRRRMGGGRRFGGGGGGRGMGRGGGGGGGGRGGRRG